MSNKEDADNSGSEEYASKNVSEFLFGVINQLDLEYSDNDIETQREQFLDALNKLYPEGVRGQEIWTRASAYHGDHSATHFGDTVPVVSVI